MFTKGEKYIFFNDICVFTAPWKLGNIHIPNVSELTLVICSDNPNSILLALAMA